MLLGNSSVKSNDILNHFVLFRVILIMHAMQIGKVLGIALRTQPKGPMREVQSAHAVVDHGLEGDLASQPERGITLLASGQWNQVVRELAANIPWHTRRANVLIESDGLSHLIGKEIAIGDVIIQINAETVPCGLMDQLVPGLRNVLKPDCRGGVNGRILNGGVIKIGDEVILQETRASIR